MRRAIFTMFIVSSLLLNSYAFSQVDHEPIAGQSFKGEVMIDASPQAVWAVLTDVQKRGSALGFDYEGTAAKMERVGDNVRLKIWEDTGTEFLSFTRPEIEVRYLWEPDNATYICQERWTLAPEGDGTRLTFEQRYTESDPQTAEALAEEAKSHNQALAKLKALCEGE